MREFLRGLELDKDTINTIMREVGKNFKDIKQKIRQSQATIEEYEKRVNEYEEQIKGYEQQIGELNGTIENNSKELETIQKLTNENNDLKAQLQMSDSNVKKEFSKFVTNEVMSNVNDETDFATALENYKKDNPQYFGETVVRKVQTSPKLNNAGGETNASSIMNDAIRQAVSNK